MKTEDERPQQEARRNNLEDERGRTPRARRAAFGLLPVALFFLFSCSIPNLEDPACTAARGAAKEFYSYHFGNEMRFSPENLAPREKFLTPEYAGSLRGAATDGDPFTTGDADYPKAFRIGGCRLVEPEKTDVEVLLFWRDDARNEQREIHAEVVKRGDAWLINKIAN